jgi:hypothetical protein
MDIGEKKIHLPLPRIELRPYSPLLYRLSYPGSMMMMMIIIIMGVVLVVLNKRVTKRPFEAGLIPDSLRI